MGGSVSGNTPVLYGKVTFSRQRSDFLFVSNVDRLELAAGNRVLTTFGS